MGDDSKKSAKEEKRSDIDAHGPGITCDCHHMLAGPLKLSVVAPGPMSITLLAL